MRRLLFFILFALIFAISCVNKPIIVNKTFSPEQHELFSQCSGLKGIGDFIVGETTYKQVLRSKLYSGQYIFDGFYNGYWGIANEIGGFGNHEKANWISKNSPAIRQIATPIGGVTIGQIQLSRFDLAFYNDILAAIYYEDEKSLLHNHYIEKYGDGRGTYYSYHQDNEPCRNRMRLYSNSTEEERRIWENEKVELLFEHNSHFEMGPNISEKQMISSSYNNSWYILSSKALYPRFLEELDRQKKAYDEYKQGKDKESLNQF